MTKNRPLDITLNEGFSYKFKLKIAKDDRSEMKNTGVQYEMKPQMKEKQECFNDNDQEGIYLRSKGYPNWSANNCRHLLNDMKYVNCSLSKTRGILPKSVENQIFADNIQKSCK